MNTPLYAPNTVNAKRLATDTFFEDTHAASCFEGLIDHTIRAIEEAQLLDGAVWARFVSQYRLHSDSADRGWRGEYWGKMMRGASFTYAYTRNPALYRALTDTIEDMLRSEEASGRISTYSADTEYTGWDLWCRKYVLLGMQYFSEICTDETLAARITASMRRQADVLLAHLGPAEEGKLPITEASHCWRGLNSSTLLEPIVRLYDITGDRKYLDFASYIVREGGTSICNLIELAGEDRTAPYQYPVAKAYEMMSLFEGLLEYYRATGEERYRETVLRFAKRVMQSEITIIGSAGCTHELFDHAAVRQTDTAYQGLMQETCVTVTWMKLCYQMLLLSGDASFADCFEQSLYNAYLGAVNTEKIVDRELIGKLYPQAVTQPLPFDSYSCLLPGTRGRGIGGLLLMPDNHYYGCCACIGSAGTGLIAKTAVMLHREGVAVNLYIPGSVRTQTPAGQPVTLRTETAYPAEGAIDITLSLAQDETFTLLLRIPSWSRDTSLAVNGEAQTAACGYTAIRRAWKNGDTLSLHLDSRTQVIHAPESTRDVLMTGRSWKHDISFPLVFEPSPDAAQHIALRRGPLVLARDARLGGNVREAVHIAYDQDGYVQDEPAAAPSFSTQLARRIPQTDGASVIMIDYGSAGKTWQEDSAYGCWLPTVD